MKHSIYKKIMKTIESFDYDGSCVEKIYNLYPDFEHTTLDSIYSQLVQRNVKKNYHRITKYNEISNHYNNYCKAVDSGEAPGILLRLAKRLKFSSAMMAKILLEHHMNVVAEKEGVPSYASRSKVNKLLRDTTLIQDRDLSYEVYLCLIQDDIYGPFADSMKHSVGHEYEFLLRRLLDDKKIGYQDENVLRNRGYDKTPDIKLDLPIAVNGSVINWIESKASFGDEENHKTYLRDQFWSYWNRFGPGLVIYWFGFIDELDEHREKGILVMDHLPENIIYMDPLSKS